MADDARFYYLPDGTNLTTITVGEGISDCQVRPRTWGDSARSLSGSVSTISYGHGFSVRLLLERFYDAADTRRRAFQALINHLQRGNWIAFSADHAKTWAANCTTTPGNGDLTVAVGANDFSAYSASGVVGNGDNVILQSPNPTGKVEMIRALSLTGAGSPYTITLVASSQVELDHAATTMARWEYFFPRLRLDPDARGADLLTSENGWVWTLDLPLVSDPVAEHAAL